VEIPTNIETCKAQLQQVSLAFCNALKEELKTRKLCQAHQANLLKDLEAKGHFKEAKHIHGMQTAEEKAQLWKKCTAARGLNKEGGLTYLLVPTDPNADPKECEQWTRVDDQEQM
jgi:hypothetical protein